MPCALCSMSSAPNPLPLIAVCSTELSVGDDGFVETVKANLGRLVSRMSVSEDPALSQQRPRKGICSRFWYFPCLSFCCLPH